MRRWIVVALACVTVSSIGSQVASACGDKFLVVGRGVRFQRAYAAIHPASILIVLPSKNVKAAAVRDSRLLTELKMAGHRVEVVQQPVNLSEVLGRSRHDIVLAEQADLAGVRNVAGASAQPQPSIVAVLEDPSPADLAAALQQQEVVLKTPQSLSQILNLLDDVMKARLDALRRTPAGA
jgi:hypothetical protein